jgi:hypothetical protein
MNGGAAFAIVFLIVVLVLGLGFLSNEQLDNMVIQETNREVETKLAEKIKKLESEKQELETKTQAMEQELSSLKATNTTLSTKLQQATSANSDLANRYVSIEKELSAAQAKIQSLESQQAAVPVTGDEAKQQDAVDPSVSSEATSLYRKYEYFGLPLFAVIGIALFAAAAFFSNQHGRSRGSDRQAYYTKDDGTIYIKMSRAEARRYAQAKRRG